jgi:5-methylcytosine-specific restriction protein A
LDVDAEFTIHLPNKHRTNLLHPRIGDLIILYQNVNGIPCFTHIVTPIDSRERIEPREQYSYGRTVSVIAKSDIDNAIPRVQIGWNEVDFRGISQGNFCEISHITNISSEKHLNVLKGVLWNAFAPFFMNEYIESVENLSSAENDVDGELDGFSRTEGGRKLVWHIARERDKSIVREKKRRAIAEGNLNCEVCKFSFKDKFEINFIECHHRTPISTGGERETTLEDLALVCANCHRMLHKLIDGSYLAVEELSNRFY